MPWNIKDKKKEMRELTSEIIEDYNDTIKAYQNTREKMDDAQDTLEKQKDEVEKTRAYWEHIPEDQTLGDNPSVISMMGSSLDLTRSLQKHVVRVKIQAEKMSEESNNHLLAAQSGGSTTTTMSFLSSSIAGTIVTDECYATDYAYLREKFETLKVPTPYENKEKCQILLQEIEPRLSDKLEGIWQTRRDEYKKGMCLKAAHLMRELISELLQILAPDEDVMSQGWFVAEKDDGHPTQWQRAKYAMIGKSEDISDENLEPIENLAKDIRKRYTELNKIAHLREEEDTGVVHLIDTYLDSSQKLIIDLIEKRKKYFK